MESVLAPSNLAFFIPAVVLLLITPGPVVLYIITRSVNQGHRAGLISVAGLELGNFCHVIAAALGLSAILLSSALLFDVVKYLGAAYLIYLGIRKLRSRTDVHDPAVQDESLRRVFWQGIVVAVLNPKTALFFLAFFPQFIDPSRGHVAGQILILGTLMVGMATISDSIWALTTGSLGRWLRGNLRYLRAERYVSGTVYIGLGITAALAGGNHK
jgi:threonine/homoserine/homoserine lactone efflux protein